MKITDIVLTGGKLGELKLRRNKQSSEMPVDAIAVDSSLGIVRNTP